MATAPAPGSDEPDIQSDRFRIFRNTRNHLIIHVHDRHRNIHYLHRFTCEAELHAYIRQLRDGCSVRVPDALLAVED